MESRGINVSNAVKTKQKWIVEGNIQMMKGDVHRSCVWMDVDLGKKREL